MWDCGWIGWVIKCQWILLRLLGPCAERQGSRRRGISSSEWWSSKGLLVRTIVMQVCKDPLHCIQGYWKSQSASFQPKRKSWSKSSWSKFLGHEGQMPVWVGGWSKVLLRCLPTWTSSGKFKHLCYQQCFLHRKVKSHWSKRADNGSMTKNNLTLQKSLNTEDIWSASMTTIYKRNAKCNLIFCNLISNLHKPNHK